MLIDPPVDKLIKRVDCKFALACVITKRARFLLDKNAELVGTSSARAINHAAREIYEDRIKVVND